AARCGLDRPLLAQDRDAARIERSARKARVALHLDAFGEPKAHQQELVGGLARGERLVGDDAMAARLDAQKPSLGPLLGRSRAALAVDVKAAVGARSDPGIFVGAPVDEVVAAFGARPRVVRNLIGRQSCGGADLLRGVVEGARQVLVRNLELAGLM